MSRKNRWLLQALVLSSVLLLLPAACGTSQPAPTPTPVPTRDPALLPGLRPITVENAAAVHLLRTLRLPAFSASATSQCSVDFGPDGTRLAGVCYKSTAPIWEVSSGRLLRTLRDAPVHDVAVSFSPDGTLIALGGFGNEIGLYDPATGELRRALGPVSAPTWDLDLGPDGDNLAVASFDRESPASPGMHLWRVSDGRLLWDGGADGTQRRLLSVAYDPTGELIAYGTLDDGAVIVQARTGQLATTLPIAAHVGDLAFSPDGQWLATGSDDFKIRLWRAADGQLLDTLEGHTQYVNGVAFSPDGRLLVSGSRDRKVGLWDVQTGQLVAWLAGHENAVLRVDVNPAGTLIASISWDGTVRLWGAAADE